MKRLVLAAALVLALAACGGGGSHAANPDIAKITQVYTSFFSSKAPVASKPALVQDGAAFKSAILALSANPLASNSSAKVSKVTMNGSSKATVVFSIYLGSSPVLKDQKGQALKLNGKWVIASATLCRLVMLEGASTPACAP